MAGNSTNSESPKSSGDGGVYNSPKGRDYGEDYASDNGVKKPVWKKPANTDMEGGPVMGAVSWPALSKASPKSPSSESLKLLPEASLPSSPQGAVNAIPFTPNYITANNASPGSIPNHVTPPPTRQRSMKRVGGTSSGGVSTNGGFPQAPPPPTPQMEMPVNNYGKPGITAGDSSHKEAGQRGGFGPQSPRADNHQQQRNSFKRSNSGLHPRRDGSYHQNHQSYVGRRDQDHGNQDWNAHRNFTPQQQRVVPMGFIQHPHHATNTFIPPQPVAVRPFGPMGYPDVTSPVIYVQVPSPSMPMVGPVSPHAMYFPPPEPMLFPSKIVNQIDYYFSNENLIKDTYLRQNMDDQGWVPITLIAKFRKVTYLTDNIQLILDSLRSSNVVEVQGDKVRRRIDWKRWLLPQVPPQSSGPDTLEAQLQSCSLNEPSAMG